MKTKRWSSVSVPSALMEDVKRVVPWLGFSSAGEYVRSAIRTQVRKDLILVEDREELLEVKKDEQAIQETPA